MLLRKNCFRKSLIDYTFMKTKRKWAIRNGISPSNNLIIPPAGRLQRLHICPLRRNRRTARRRRPHCRSGRRNGCKNLRFHRKIRVRGSVPASGPAPAADSPGRAAAPRRGIRPCLRRQPRGRASATPPPIFSSQVPSRPAISRWLGLSSHASRSSENFSQIEGYFTP